MWKYCEFEDRLAVIELVKSASQLVKACRDQHRQTCAPSVGVREKSRNMAGFHSAQFHLISIKIGFLRYGTQYASVRFDERFGSVNGSVRCGSKNPVQFGATLSCQQNCIHIRRAGEMYINIH